MGRTFLESGQHARPWPTQTAKWTRQPNDPGATERPFIVTIGEDGEVQFTVTAFSRPGDPLSGVIGPLGRTIQSAATSGYLRAMRKYPAQAAQS